VHVRIFGEFEVVDGAWRCRPDLLLMCFDETTEERPEDGCVPGPGHDAPAAWRDRGPSGLVLQWRLTRSRRGRQDCARSAGRAAQPPTTVLLPRPRNRSLVSRSSNAPTTTRLWRWPRATRAPERPNGQDRGPQGVQRRDRPVRRSLRAAEVEVVDVLAWGWAANRSSSYGRPRAKRR
jgi:hypothetical protein